MANVVATQEKAEPHPPGHDPNVVLVGQEQLARSQRVEKMGHAAYDAERDERNPADRTRVVAGISALSVDDGIRHEQAKQDPAKQADPPKDKVPAANARPAVPQQAASATPVKPATTGGKL